MPAIVAAAGDGAARRFLEFFAVTLENLNTREAEQRSEFASIVAERRDADRMFDGLLARNLDATIALEDLSASDDE